VIEIIVIIKTVNDARGNWIADPFDAPNVRENLSYEIINPNTNKSHYPPADKPVHYHHTAQK
jgi:hypothetical protein